MFNCYTAVCAKEFYWKGETKKHGSPIELNEEDMQSLYAAGLIGAMKKIVTEARGETAMREPPENAMRQNPRKGRP